MIIGRNFTNLLETMFLTDCEKESLKKGLLSVSDMDAEVQIKSKRDIPFQIDVAKEIGLSHIELDGGIPNPFLSMTEEEIETAKKKSKDSGITLSLHLPYTFVSESIVSFQKEERDIAITLLKRYIDFAEKLNCIAVNMHPGRVPFYQAEGKYLDIVKKGIKECLKELAEYSSERNIKFHLENNTYFDNIFVEIDEIVEMLLSLRSLNIDINFCFDIGHWFTRGSFGLPIPDSPEDVFLKIPDEILWEVHLNDYIIEKKKFHPPLHYEAGLLKRENLRNLSGYFKEKGVELIVVETAVRDIDELLNSKELLLKEMAYLKEVFCE